MGEYNVDGATATDLTNTITDYSVSTMQTDGVSDQKETTWQMQKWTTWYGYYNQVPELKSAIDAKANWVVGGGFTADPITELILSVVKGHGKDSFNSILKNMVRIYTAAGDSFAEIIRDKRGRLVNIKPLDPSSIIVVANQQGIIKRYEQASKTKAPKKRFKPEEILHLSHRRNADEMHGYGIIEPCENLILARNEAITDWKRVLHRNVEPVFFYHVDTDDETEINTIKTKLDNARKSGENIIIPKDVIVPEQVSTAINSTLNPITWIDQLNDYFFQAVGVPQIIVGKSKNFTDASAKIAYLAFEQTVKEEQLYIEEQILNQLNLEIQLTFPTSLQSDAISNIPQEEKVRSAVQENDQVAELEGRR